MASWYDLPLEVKQLILQYIIPAKSITYLAIDKRRRLDQESRQTNHFHNVLLVSRNFVTTDDLAFAVLSTAKLTFDSYCKLRRLVEEASPAFKNYTRHLHLHRQW